MFESGILRFFPLIELGVLIIVAIQSRIEQWTFQQAVLTFIVGSIVGNALVFFKYGWGV